MRCRVAPALLPPSVGCPRHQSCLGSPGFGRLLPRLGGFVTGAAALFDSGVCVSTYTAIGAKGCANVLKETIISGIVLAFMPKKPMPKAQVFDRSNAVDVEPVSAPIGTHSGTDARADVWPKMTAIEAAKAFYLEMQHHAAGDALQMRWVRHSYDVLARERGWPALSDKSLSQHMVSFGCKRRKADLRKSGGGRVTVFEFPVETTAQRRRRQK